jgi:hypothetical protein
MSFQHEEQLPTQLETPVVYPGISRENAIRNGKILLNQKLRQHGYNNPEVRNSGYEIDINTLTAIKAQVTTQKFYKLGDLKPSDFIPINVGENAYASEALTYTSFQASGDWRKCIFDPATPMARVEKVDVVLEAVLTPYKYFMTSDSYNLIELNQAQKSGNWSLIEARELTMYELWRQAIQETAFQGIDGVTISGLLNASGPTVDTDLMKAGSGGLGIAIKDMNKDEFNFFLANIFSIYFGYTNNTVLPDVFVLPTDDFLGLGAATSEDFPIKSKLTRMKEAFQEATSNPNFKILHSAYGQAEQMTAAGGSLPVTHPRYALYRYDPTSLRMDIPIDYLSTAYDTIQGFEYQSNVYGQFSGVTFLRPKETVYFDLVQV